MADNFDNIYSANLIGLWDFLDGNESGDTGLADGIMQDGTIVGPGTAHAGWFNTYNEGVRFDVDDGDDAPFDLTTGSIVTKFRPDQPTEGSQTVVSRGLSEEDDASYFAVRTTEDGAVEVYHSLGGESALLTTDPGFFATGDYIQVTYSWTPDGVQMLVANETQGTEATAAADVTGLSFDLTGDDEQSFALAAQETTEGSFEQPFSGQIDFLAVLDDNVLEPPVGGLDGIVEGTDGDDLIDTSYTGDPEGDMVDHEDAIDPAAEPNDDVIEAYDGNDTIYAGEGSDSVTGGEGDDVIDTSGGLPLPDRGFDGYTGTTPNIPAVPADADPDDDRDTVDGGAGNDMILTGDDADVIAGGTGDDTIDGGIDDDIIDGGGDDDVIIGGEGSDSILGGAGSDTLYGGLDESFPDALNITDDGSDGRPVDPDPTNGMDTIEGGAGNDVIFGQDDDDDLSGGTGNDMIDAGIDDDTVDGGEGDDTILGGQGDDVLTGGAGLDAIDLGEGEGEGADVAYGGINSDSFTGIGQGDVVYGGEDEDDSDVDVLNLRDVAEAQNPGGSLIVELDDANPENGVVSFLNADGEVTGTANFYEIENVIYPCFTPGTLIATPDGERRVEELQVGDRVITRDNGIQSIRWLGQQSLDAEALKRAEHLQPILIREGALGNGLPERDMMVSPNHRVLVANDKTALYFEDREVLVAAKHLVGLEGIDAVETSTVTYIHFMFDQHEVVLSDGAWTESFQPGDQTLRGLDNAQRNEIYEIFPELKSEQGRLDYSAARRSLKRHEARLLMH